MSKIKFPKELREKWLKALRGGKYQQTKSILRDSYDNAYCCLGVCARLLNIPTNKLELACSPADSELDFKYASKFPKALAIVNKRTKTVRDTKFCGELIEMNDSENKTFKEIADYIEKKTIGV